MEIETVIAIQFEVNVTEETENLQFHLVCMGTQAAFRQENSFAELHA